MKVRSTTNSFVCYFPVALVTLARHHDNTVLLFVLVAGGRADLQGGSGVTAEGPTPFQVGNHGDAEVTLDRTLSLQVGNYGDIDGPG